LYHDDYPAAVTPRRVYLLRHAHADGTVADPRRPLSARGHGQAQRLAALLSPTAIDRVQSSPRPRCLQTVEPLARARHLDVEEEDALLEGTHPAETLRHLEDVEAAGVVACTHGDIIPGLLDLLRADGVELPPSPAWPTASAWLLEGDGDGFRRAAYLPPP
jgi:broad specificity phosphatase PhoE